MTSERKYTLPFEKIIKYVESSYDHFIAKKTEWLEVGEKITVLENMVI